MSQPIDMEILLPLRAPLTSLPGLGPRLASLLAKLVGGNTVRDALFHLPIEFIDRRATPSIASAQPGKAVTLRVEIVGHEAPLRKGQPWRVLMKDETGMAEIVLFHAVRLSQFPIGARLIIAGKLERFQDRLVMPHPDHVVSTLQDDQFPWIEPIWPLAAGITPRTMRKAALGALARLPSFPEWLNKTVLAKREWGSFEDSLKALQAPREIPDHRARQRLAYDELLARQIAFAVARGRRHRQSGRALVGDNRLRAKALAAFSHPPTQGQLQAMAEISADMEAPHRMRRLLQGDVGAGKTLVALMAALQAVEAGAQVAIMAPTEILAQQHAATFEKLSPVRVALLTGSTKAAARREILAGVKAGAIPILIGTHAIFQKTVVFHDLGLAIIDEQHRFGVDQRLALGAKGESADLLVMTATPIPRTLLLTHWAEMDVSRITEKPLGRMPITTTLHKLSDLARIEDAIARAIQSGGRVYWVCPLVTESEALDVTATEMRFAHLQARFGNHVTMAHGQMEPAQRDAALRDFAAGNKVILVATTVIEVGVDVPEANIMVIEHAERFGLAQLHQLRGRVGRGREKSFCLLLHEDNISRTAAKRLAILRETEDGFLISDEDFHMRGAGEFLGTRQSGMPDYHLADPERDKDLLEMARQDAIMILEQDPKLIDKRGQALRILLNLFDQREAIETVNAG